MERKAHRSGRFLVRLLVLSFAGFVVAALHHERKADIEPELDAPKPRREALDPTSETPAVRRRLSTPRRLAVGFALTAIFFAGAAFTAGAGNEVAGLLEQTSSTDTTAASAPAPDASATTPAEDPAAAPAPAPAPETSTEAAPSAPADSSSSDSSADDAPATGHGSSRSAEPPDQAASSESPGGGGAAAAAPAVTPAPLTPSPKPAPRPHPAVKRSHAHSQWVLDVPRAKGPAARAHHRHARVASAAEEARETPGAAPVIWLNRTLPDPTPPSRRLAMRFAHRLVSISRANHVNWALVLGVLRAQGRNGAVPANGAELRQTARALDAVAGRGNWNAALAVTGRTAIADQAVALMHYDRAVGMSGLVDGLLAHKDDLVNRVLHDGRVTIYPGGRQDLASGRVDIRVVVLIEYLADTYGQVTVSCLISGHRLYARPGVISAHIYGRAVDVADLGGIPVFGHQEPGGITERAVRAILLLPSELQPKQVISLLGLGGPSFPLANHYDHIHIGY
jgi:hypothetical protein